MPSSSPFSCALLRRAEAIARARNDTPTPNLQAARAQLVEACRRVADGAPLDDVLSAVRVWTHYEAEFLQESGLGR